MTRVDHAIEQLWALGDPAFADELPAAADTLEAFAAAKLLDATDAADWRARFDRATRGPLRWPPPRPEVRARALALLRERAGAGEGRAAGIARHLTEMNVITARDADAINAETYPGGEVEPGQAQHVVAVGVEQPLPGARLDVIWIMRSTTLLTVRWRLQGVEFTRGDPRVEPPPDHLRRFELRSADGAGSRPAAGGYHGGVDGAWGTLEFRPVPAQGPATLRFDDEERQVVVP